jgi:hypothetical protein
MATKKQRRTSDLKTKKKRKGTRLLILSLITMAVFGSLIFLFVTLFDSLYPPVTGNKPGYAKREKWTVTLYFSDANERFLTPERRLIPKEKDVAGQVRELVKALLDGSKMKLVNTFPLKTEVQNVKIGDGGKAYVSFNKNLIRKHPGGSASEMATIYSLTNTLAANIPAIKEVILLVDGKELASIGGHIDTRRSFTPNKDLLAPSAKEG